MASLVTFLPGYTEKAAVTAPLVVSDSNTGWPGLWHCPSLCCAVWRQEVPPATADRAVFLDLPPRLGTGRRFTRRQPQPQPGVVSGMGTGLPSRRQAVLTFRMGPLITSWVQECERRGLLNWDAPSAEIGGYRGSETLGVTGQCSVCLALAPGGERV